MNAAEQPIGLRRGAGIGLLIVLSLLCAPVLAVIWWARFSGERRS